MAVKIGHASISEKSSVNGVKGDQTGREVCTRDWYSKPWIAIIRPKNTKDADKIASAMEAACANDNIGYGQADRTTLFVAAKEKNWNIAAVNTKVNTDCSALVSVCVNAAGIPVSKDIYTGNEKQALVNTGKFDVFNDSKYIGKSDNLKRGDILLGSGHTAIVLSNGSGTSNSSKNTSKNTSKEVKAKCAAINMSKDMAGTYTVHAFSLNMRHGAGTKYDVMTSLPKGTKVKNYGYYSNASDKSVWLYVHVTLNGVTYTGFCSKKYLLKQFE